MYFEASHTKEKISSTAQVMKSIKRIVSNSDLGKTDQSKKYRFLLILYLSLIVNIGIVTKITTIQHLVIPF